MKTCTVELQGQCFTAALCRTFGLIFVPRGSDMLGNHNIIHTSPNGHESLCTTLTRSPDGVCAVLFYVFHMF